MSRHRPRVSTVGVTLHHVPIKPGTRKVLTGGGGQEGSTRGGVQKGFDQIGDGRRLDGTTWWTTQVSCPSVLEGNATRFSPHNA